MRRARVYDRAENDNVSCGTNAEQRVYRGSENPSCSSFERSYTGNNSFGLAVTDTIFTIFFRFADSSASFFFLHPPSFTSRFPSFPETNCSDLSDLDERTSVVVVVV